MKTNLLVATLFVAAFAATLLSASSATAAPFAASCLLALAVAVLAANLIDSQWPIIPAAMVLLVGACLGALQLILQTSASAVLTAQKCVQLCTLGLLSVSASVLFHSDRDRWLLLRLFAAGAGVIAVFALVQPFAGNLGLPWIASPADAMVGPFQNRNTYACFAELAFPVAVWAGRRFGMEWWLPAGALIASVLATGSRAGALLVLSEAVILGFWTRSGVAAAVLSVTAAIGIAWGGGVLTERLGYRDPLNHRREIYASALELLSVRPLAGWGLGAFEQVYPSQARFDLGKQVNHVHNDWLETAVEGGLPFAAVAGGGILLLLWRSRHCVWALGLSAVTVHSLVDFPFQRLGVSVWFFLIAAAVEAQHHSEHRRRLSKNTSHRQLKLDHLSRKEALLTVGK